MRIKALWIAAALALFLTGTAVAQQGEPPVEGQPAAAEPAPAPAEPTTQEPVTPEPAAAEPAAQPPSSVAGGVRSAATETAAALERGGRGAVEQGRSLWRDALIPIWDRIAAALPGVVKAVVVLLIFWIVAVSAGAGVRKLLGLTRLDDRAATEWGLAGLLRAKDGTARSIEAVAGTFVKWVILLFGFVAFFQALDLSMVAGPLEGIIDRIVGIVPNLLQAAVILFAYWVVATLLRMLVSRGLGAVGFDERVGRYIPKREIKGEEVGPSALVGRLAFYLVLLFGLAPFLDALGQRALVAPLSEMLEKALAFLPNVFGALIIFFLGHLIATVVREIVSSFLAATGVDGWLARAGLEKAVEKLKLSEVVGTIAYFFIIVPVIAASVEALGIDAIASPVTRTLDTMLQAVPLIFVALVVLAVGFFLARIVRRIVESFLKGVGFDSLPPKLGLGFLEPAPGKPGLSELAGAVVMLVILLLVVEQALASLQLDKLADLVGTLIAYLPQLAVGLALILAALSLSAYVGRLVESALGERSYGRTLAWIAKGAILLVGFSMGLNELGLAEDVVIVAVAAALGGTALALGLAFGLGGRERAREVIERAAPSGQ